MLCKNVFLLKVSVEPISMITLMGGKVWCFSFLCHVLGNTICPLSVGENFSLKRDTSSSHLFAVSVLIKTNWLL